MHILNLCNGQLGGNSEILLKIVLTHAETFDLAITTSWIHVPSLVIPPNPKPLDGAMDVSVGTNKGQMSGTAATKDQADDRRAALNAILHADAIIVSSATYSHQPPGFLKVLMDRIGDPYLDVGFVTSALEKQKAGDLMFANFKYDPRLLKPRTLGFIITGGSTTLDQFSMALPSLHLLFYCLHAKLVDQLVGKNVMDTGSVLLRPDILQRARTLAERVVSQRADRSTKRSTFPLPEPGSCPYCHLSTIELFQDGSNGVGCITCGARGRLAVNSDGQILPKFEEDSEWSYLTMKGKIKQGEDILSWGERERGRMAGV